MALGLSDADLISMDQFPLRRRWTDARWDLLPASDLARLYPLTETKAKEIWKYMGVRSWFGWTGLDPRQFVDLAEIDDQHNLGPGIVRRWLQERLAGESERIWVSIDNTSGLVTDTDVFCRYWNDFCYPSDNVFVWPFSEAWALFYFHEETLYWGRRRGAGKR